MLLEDIARGALASWGPRTANQLSDLVGEDKFRLHDVLRKLVRRGECTSRVNNPPDTRVRFLPDDEVFTVKRGSKR